MGPKILGSESLGGDSGLGLETGSARRSPGQLSESYTTLLVQIPNSVQEDPWTLEPERQMLRMEMHWAPPPYAEQEEGLGRLARPELPCQGLLYLKPGECWGLGVTRARIPPVCAAFLEFLSRMSRAYGNFSMRSWLRSGEMTVIHCFCGSQGMRKFIHLVAEAYSKSF